MITYFIVLGAIDALTPEVMMIFLVLRCDQPNSRIHNVLCTSRQLTQMILPIIIFHLIFSAVLLFSLFFSNTAPSSDVGVSLQLATWETTARPAPANAMQIPYCDSVERLTSNHDQVTHAHRRQQ